MLVERLTFIPRDPYHRVPDDMQPAIMEHLRERYPLPTGIRVWTADTHPFFVDSASDEMTIRCSCCGSAIDYLEWQVAMTDCAVDQTAEFDLKAVGFSCCGEMVSLADLEYNPHQGFAMTAFHLNLPMRTDHEPSVRFLSEISEVEFCVVV